MVHGEIQTSDLKNDSNLLATELLYSTAIFYKW